LPTIDIGLGIFRNPSLMGAYQGNPPLLPPKDSSQVYVVSSDGFESSDEPSK